MHIRFFFKKPIVFLLTTLPAIVQAQTGNYTIKGSLTRATLQDTVLLNYRDQSGQKKEAITVIRNGKFEFKGAINEPLAATLTIKHKKAPDTEDKLKIYLTAGNTLVNTKNLISESSFGGTKLNDDYYLYQQEDKQFTNRYDSLEAATGRASREQQESKEFQSTQRKKEKEIDKAYALSKQRFAQEHLNSIAGILALSDFAYNEDYQFVQPIFDRFSDEVKNSIDGKSFARKLDKLRITAIGAIAPDFTQPDSSGKMVSLSSFRGKYVLVDFWASWCVPCRQENPNVVEAYKKFNDKGFTVLGVSMDGPKDRSRWLKAIVDDHLNWTQVSELKFMRSTAALTYGIEAIPQNVLIDPSGKIVGRNLRGEDLQNKLSEILK